MRDLCPRLHIVALSAVVALGTACGKTAAQQAEFPPLAKKWFDRAAESYREGDVEDAQIAIENALRVTPDRPDVRLLAAKVSLAQLELDRTVELLGDQAGSEASGLRGRAFWYSGQLERAADELEALLADPEVRDPWARDIARLARRGSGRKPFSITGGLLAVAEMPQVAQAALVVPVEVNGEPALGMIATNVPEAVLDSSTGAQPSWISLRFGEKLEVRDVPALTQDLSGLSRQLKAPIKILLGTHLLRHINPTFDFTGAQFVARSFEPPPPPRSTTVKLNYLRGGGMLMRSAIGEGRQAPPVSLLVDTSLVFPVALDEQGWKTAGMPVSTLEPVPGAPEIRQGVLPFLHVGAFEVPRVPAVHTTTVDDLERALGVDVDGMVGAGLLAAFRVTLVDGGRTMWLEDTLADAGAEPTEQPTAPRGPGPDGISPPELSPPTIDEGPAPSTPGAAPAPKTGRSGPPSPAGARPTAPVPALGLAPGSARPTAPR